METRIQKTLKQWFSNAFADEMKANPDSDYEILQQFAGYTLKLIGEKNENSKEPFKIVDILYQKGSLHDKNAIENEFFSILSKAESPGTLKSHLELMPDNLKPVYLKTILEN
ncbi:MAG: hypothetical protein AB2L20_26725 [Mangrovibacterium sp.]